MKTDKEPADISSHLLNFQVYLREKRILDESGRITDMQAFREAIVTTIPKPIVITDMSKLREMLDEEQPILTVIKVFIVFSGGKPVRAHFRKYRAKLGPGETLEEYTVRKTDGEITIKGPRELSAIESDAVFESLALDVAAVKIFDDEPAHVAEALRDMIQE
jgi:hypothetical protein